MSSRPKAALPNPARLLKDASNLLAGKRSVELVPGSSRFGPDVDVPEWDASERKRISQLIESPQMSCAWRALSRIPAFGIQDVYEFLDNCLAPIAFYDSAPRLTPTEHRRRYVRVASAARNLASVLATDLEFYDLQHPAMFECTDKTICADVAVSGVPKVATLLEEIAQRSIEVAQSGPPSRKPNAKGAKRAYFIAHLSDHLRESYGKPLHEVVAAVASTLFEDDVSADLVKKIVSKRQRTRKGN